jgi:hypothetical protein
MTTRIVLDPMPTEHEKAEWSRMAQDAYWRGRNDMGHRFSAAAAYRRMERMPQAKFDALMELYRGWLVFGWTRVDEILATGVGVASW